MVQTFCVGQQHQYLEFGCPGRTDNHRWLHINCNNNTLGVYAPISQNGALFFRTMQESLLIGTVYMHKEGNYTGCPRKKLNTITALNVRSLLNIGAHFRNIYSIAL